MKQVTLLILFAVLVAGCTSDGAEEEPKGPEMTTATALQLIDDEQEISCGPFVDGVVDQGETFESGRCAGQQCEDPSGCMCVICDNDQGVCAGPNREAEACEPLGEPPGRWRLEAAQEVLIFSPVDR